MIKQQQQQLNFVFLGDGRVEDEKERDEKKMGQIMMRN